MHTKGIDKQYALDAGKVSNVKNAVITLSTQSLLGGIYLCA